MTSPGRSPFLRPLLRALRLRLVPALVVAAVALAPAPADAARRKGLPDVVEDALAYATTDREKAILLLEEALSSGTSARDIDPVTVHAGEQRRLNGDRAEAHRWFSDVVGRGAKSPDAAAARLGLALLDADDALDARVLAMLNDVSEKEALASQNADRYLLLAVDAARRDETSKVASWSKKALVASRADPGQHARIEARLATLAKGVVEPDEPRDGSPLDRAEAAYAAGDLIEARRWAEKLAAAAGDPATQATAKGLLRTLDGAAVDRDRIVVLLPLSGKYEGVGQSVRDALVFGYGSASRRLSFVDSGATPDSAVAALEKAVLQDGAIAVVGPLLSDETDAVVAAAEALHVPLLSLSQSYEDTTGHHWALAGMYTRADQISALLDHLMRDKGMKSSAMFSPDNAFGPHAAELFEQGVVARGGRIATKASYGAEDPNLLTYARKLGSREGNLRELREQAAQRGGNPNTVVLPPKIDFEGLFLPESAVRTPLACAALAYEEFPMGDFTPSKDIPKVPLLGLASWNTQTLVTTGNEYTRNSLFPDVFSPTVAGDADPFVVAYREKTGRTPTALEAAAVDAAKLLAAAARSDAAERGPFRAALLEAAPTDPVTGVTGFDPADLTLRRKMLILTLTRNEVAKVGEVTLD